MVCFFILENKPYRETTNLLFDRGAVDVLDIADAAEIRFAVSAAAGVGFAHIECSDLT